MIVRTHRLLLAAILVGSAGLRVAEACSCYDNPPCAAVWKADAVFVGTVVERAQEPIGGTINWTVHHVAVNQRLHGSVEPFVTVPVPSRPTVEEIKASESFGSQVERQSTCDYEFQPGRQYLIYARMTNDGQWTTSECSGTKPIERAAPDLEYIGGVPRTAPTGRLYGSVERIVLDPATAEPTPACSRHPGRTRQQLGSIDGVHGRPGKVRCPGCAQRIQDRARRAGHHPCLRLSIRGIRGRPRMRAGAFLDHCERQNRRAYRGAGRITCRAGIGRCRSGRPSCGQRPDDHTTAPAGSTDEKGDFRVDAILPGRYVVAVNARSGPRLDAPYPTTYFPGGAREQAEVVEVAEGERKSGYTIMVRSIEETTVSGVVLFGDDRPAAGANVSAAQVDRRHMYLGSTKQTVTGDSNFVSWLE